MTWPESESTESKLPTKYALAICGAESGMRVPLKAAYSALLAESNELKNHCGAIRLKRQCILVTAKEKNNFEPRVQI